MINWFHVKSILWQFDAFESLSRNISSCIWNYQNGSFRISWSSKLISRKIWVTVKSSKFHTSCMICDLCFFHTLSSNFTWNQKSFYNFLTSQMTAITFWSEDISEQNEIQSISSPIFPNPTERGQQQDVNFAAILLSQLNLFHVFFVSYVRISADSMATRL